MDLNDYVIDALVRQKLSETRALAAHCARVREALSVRPALRERLGVALIAFGQRLVGTPPARPSYAARRGSHA